VRWFVYVEIYVRVFCLGEAEEVGGLCARMGCCVRAGLWSGKDRLDSESGMRRGKGERRGKQ